MKTLMDRNWKWMLVVYLVAMAILTIGGSLYMTGSNNWDRGIFWTTPVDGRTYDTEVTMNGQIYAKDDIKYAEFIINDEKIFPIERTSIYHKGEKLFTTSVFINEIQVFEGTNDIKVRIVTENDDYIFDALTINAVKDYGDNTFRMFSLAHLLAVIAVIIVFFVLLGAYFFKPTENVRTVIYIITAVMTLDSDIIDRIVRLVNGGLNITWGLPLHMCDISAIFVFVLFFMKKGKARDILYNLMFIWGVGGAIMALLTPDLPGAAVQSVKFYSFFLRHGGIAIAVLLVTFIEGYRPKLKYLPQTMGITIAIALGVFGIDHLLRIFPPYDYANYMFLIYPPLGGSPIDMVKDIFGPSPYYIIGLIPLALIVYLAFWVPFGIEGLIKQRLSAKKT